MFQILSDIFILLTGLQYLDNFRQNVKLDRTTLVNVANTSLATKLSSSMAKQLAADVVDAVLTIKPPPPPKGSSKYLAV